jgi:hypothetical protein
VLSASSPPAGTPAEAKTETRATATSPAPPVAHHVAPAAPPGPGASRKGHGAKPIAEPAATPASPSVNPAASAAGEASTDPTPSAATPVAEPPPPPPPPPRAPEPPPPPAVAPPAPPPRPSFDPATATVQIGAATNTTGTTAANVNKTIAWVGVKMTACYRSALARSNEGLEGQATLHVETNEDGIIMEALLDGRLAEIVGPCIAATVRGRRIANVDTGSATADVPLTFKSR